MKVNYKELSPLLKSNGLISGWFYLSVYDFSAEKKSSDWGQYVRRWVFLENNILLTSKHENGKRDDFCVIQLDYTFKLISLLHAYMTSTFVMLTYSRHVIFIQKSVFYVLKVLQLPGLLGISRYLNTLYKHFVLASFK